MSLGRVVDQLTKVERFAGDEFAVATELDQFFWRDDDRIEPFHIAEPLGAEGHTNIVSIELCINLGYSVFGQPRCVRRRRRYVHESHDCISYRADGSYPATLKPSYVNQRNQKATPYKHSIASAEHYAPHRTHVHNPASLFTSTSCGRSRSQGPTRQGSPARRTQTARSEATSTKTFISPAGLS